MGFSVLGWKKDEAIFMIATLFVVIGVSFLQMKVGEMKTRDAQRKADVELAARALRAYYDDYKEFPRATEDGKIVSCGNKGMEMCNWGESAIVDKDNVVYLKDLPKDPFENRGWEYVYEVNPDGKDFRIYVSLEYKRDLEYKADLTRQCGTNVQCNWYVGK